ncbi:hypothetical protein HMN09_01270400 [Mycena chlorophos]|uniref:Uncharacterized protein n=1 Tax=Mycena chlorophos TaxID=658473 RepID=A0A8H6VWM7_MYCCL|nr:hypothetical protein HMN09_01270400 [Mycena chlorophos]
MASSRQGPTLPPINVLFAEVLERQTEQSTPPAVRRPSAWPGFPGPDKDALSTPSYAAGKPPPPLQIGRRASAPALNSEALRSPSIFPAVHAWESRLAKVSIAPTHHLALQGSFLLTCVCTNTWFRSKRAALLHSTMTALLAFAAAALSHRNSSPSSRIELNPIQTMTPTGSPRVYDRDGPRSAPLPVTSGCHCSRDRQIEQRRAMFQASESPYVHKQQIPTPLPPTRGHIMIAFQPTPTAYPGRSFGVCMADILDFRDCLVDPNAPVLEGDSEEVYLTLEAKGYSTFVQKISGNCAHRRISRFNLAYTIASEYDAFLKEFPFNPAGLKAAAIVVRSVTELRLVNLYSRDGGKVWRVHVAYCK